MMLAGKKILLGISGSIAAYKSILLVRLLVKSGAEVKVIMTPAAVDFVTPLTLATLSKNKVLINLSDENTWANHVQLGRWADLMIIAPLSCNTLAKMTAGLCDNLLLAAYLSATCPVVVAPAMDEDMWHHATTKKNLAFLHSLDNKVIAVRNGELASGLFGEGRMAEPEEILVFIKEHFFRGKSLKDVRALVTAGPTFESIDPVRFVGNHSSGKMGIAIAEALYFEGADVTVVAGPNVVPSIYEGISFRNITTAAQMFIECTQLFDDIQIAVMAAAVADYTPATVAAEKIKKLDTNFNLPLTKTKDILFELGQRKKKGQFLVGFALETQNEKANALKKLSAKNTDLLVLNSLRDEGAGFGKDTNKVTIFDNQGHEYPFAVKEKSEVAKDIVDIIIQNFYGKA